MNIFKKVFQKISIEKKFYLEQKLGWQTPNDPYCISKYLLKGILPEDAIMVDCGASHGSDSIELARIFPKSVIYDFEPVPHIFESLKRNTRKYKNIHCHQLALGSFTGKTKMYISSGASDGSSSLLAPKTHLNDHPDVLFNEEQDVNVMKLDDWALQNNISKIDFLWLDMQGYEFDMLQASEKMLKTVQAIHTEVSTKETYESATLYPVLKQWLAERNFKVIKEAIPDGTDMGNVLFVKANP
jgi:FkbM family methyltransferase